MMWLIALAVYVAFLFFALSLFKASRLADESAEREAARKRRERDVLRQLEQVTGKLGVSCYAGKS